MSKKLNYNEVKKGTKIAEAIRVLAQLYPIGASTERLAEITGIDHKSIGPGMHALMGRGLVRKGSLGAWFLSLNPEDKVVLVGQSTEENEEIVVGTSTIAPVKEPCGTKVAKKESGRIKTSLLPSMQMPLFSEKMGQVDGREISRDLMRKASHVAVDAFFDALKNGTEEK